jgi:hypothetical protein
MKTNNILGLGIITGILVIIMLIITMGNGTFLEDNKSVNNTSISTTSTTPREEVLGSISHSIVLDKSLPNSVDKILMYKAVPVQYNRQDIISLGQKFSIYSSDSIKESKDGISISTDDGSAYALLLNSGWAEYTNTSRAHTINPLDIPQNIPSDSEAVEIATSFLKKQNLFPNDAIFSGTTHGKIYETTSNGSKLVKWEDVNVWFDRSLNGYPVEGTQLMLAIGGNGDVIEYFTNWRNYEPTEEISVISPDQAYSDLKLEGISIGTIKADTVSINQMYLAYHACPGADTEEYLEPVWIFKGDVMVNGKSVKPVEKYVPALKGTPK